ncbi:hypothetical protein [Granulicella tundricola]|uniref:Uncharacterized protein n=1 Tax=Granulicella tundricola (strain ATCC BAA-1859 / DSM 23138 / MP5ACTX9) TaxID=1198114 RepID=E8X1Q5_GRATM|nr:hypothetical protein [Granulicella tundricola]ADW67974.1 hypothetical protein AciX9_0907 [Granulicella tundricola MP5ACTX9]
MTAEDIEVLKESVDRVLAIELVAGEQFFAEIVMVVDEPPTPDVFVLRVLREPDGVFVATSNTGESFLLADISRVARIPGVDYSSE